MTSLRSLVSKQNLPLLHYLHGGIPIGIAGGINLGIIRPHNKNKVLFVLGTTGSGKSRLSIDLATRFSGEVINSDKIQVYQGLDVLTNKISVEERCHVPHHLLGVVDPAKNFTANNFCSAATHAIRSITSRGHLPIIAGGSNSFIDALMDHQFKSMYDVCFLWVDVSMPVLHSFVSDRVDRMAQQGIVEEARQMFDPRNADYSTGLRNAIGVGEFHRYFQMEAASDAVTRAALLQEALDEVKMNTRLLASRQLEKIKRLQNVRGWKLHRVNATEVFRQRAAGGGMDKEIWENQVLKPSATIVTRFLHSKFGALISTPRTQPAFAAAATH